MAMASYGAMRIELLTRDNYETWKIQMRALLVKNDLWTYVGGIKVKPELIDGNAESREACSKWTETDEKAKADLILCISPAELKQIKNCVTSRDIWIKLEEIYQSRGPARKATLLKSLIQLKMPDTGDVRDHLRKFFDVVDKLSEMEIKIDENVLSIMLLYSLPAIEESEARRHDSGAQSADSGAFTACHHKRKNASWNSKFKPQKEVENKFKIKCFKCNKWGDHKAAQCKSQRQSTLGRKQENAGLLTSTKWNKNTADVLLASNKEKRWCLDSGCTRHLSSDESIFVTLDETDVSEVKLANNGTTEVKGCGKAVIKAEVNNNIQTVDVNDALFVPELRTNLLSVAKLCDR
ncbi:hypothetical protein AVEN_143485-1 [Araneus ventricosus]|uniref:Retrovirus-related Pol polyprotein from transposon TNT 1-94-like beta-barrel domain-containing protein n=1 Tax=Araneus ventricosus TaxID=182803 RepID=A0A4Y2PVW8_ARAVE|nr:hypothetical protein AVEN_143485-1 [Araneus ventricosus]